MKVKKTHIYNDWTHEYLSKEILITEIEDINNFIKSMESSIGTRDIIIVRHEIHKEVFHKLTIIKNDVGIYEGIERTTIYEWED